MSSLPGYTLEEFVAWNFNLIVDGLGEVNMSRGLAEALGTEKNRRPVLTEEQFKEIVEPFEGYRDSVEERLGDFDPENQSWRDYSCYCFDFIPDEAYEEAQARLKKLRGL